MWNDIKLIIKIEQLPCFSRLSNFCHNILSLKWWKYIYALMIWIGIQQYLGLFIVICYQCNVLTYYRNVKTLRVSVYFYLNIQLMVVMSSMQICNSLRKSIVELRFYRKYFWFHILLKHTLMLTQLFPQAEIYAKS